ncbi:hypothetical protein MPSEU_000285100 [Mayamaea pseudoterrestris]|nr:hypothetical protein MPSEU_000285100 [Mayamaea pseudoterrestris]
MSSRRSREAGVSIERGDFRRAADLYWQSFSQCPRQAPCRYWIFSGFSEKISKNYFAPNEDDMANLHDVLNDDREISICRVDAGLTLAVVLHNLKHDREDAADVLRQALDIADATGRKELRRRIIGKDRKEVCLRTVLLNLRKFCAENLAEMETVRLAVFPALSLADMTINQTTRLCDYMPSGTYIEGQTFLFSVPLSDPDMMRRIQSIGGKACDACGKTLEQLEVRRLDVCSRCNMAYYCSRECQVIAWKHGHKGACRHPNQRVQGDIMQLRGIEDEPDLNLQLVTLIAEEANERWKVTTLSPPLKLDMLDICKVKIIAAGTSGSSASSRTAVLEAVDQDDDANRSCLLRAMDETGAYKGVVAKQTASQVMQYFRAPNDTLSDRKKASAAAKKVSQNSEMPSTVQTKIQAMDDDTIEIRAWTIDENSMVKNCFPPTKLRRVSSNSTEHVRLLLACMEQVEEQIKQTNKIEQARDAWKATAETLEGGWEKEKSRLFHNFLTLYNGRKDELQRALENEKRLESELEPTRNKMNRLEDELAQATKQTRKRLPAHDEPHLDENELLSTEDALRLAKGPKKRPKADAKTSKKRKIAAKAPSPVTEKDAFSESSDGESRFSHRRNPVTGAMEIDGDAFLDDDSDAALPVRSSAFDDESSNDVAMKEDRKATNTTKADISADATDDSADAADAPKKDESDIWAELDSW